MALSIGDGLSFTPVVHHDFPFVRSKTPIFKRLNRWYVANITIKYTMMTGFTGATSSIVKLRQHQIAGYRML